MQTLTALAVRISLPVTASRLAATHAGRAGVQVGLTEIGRLRPREDPRGVETWALLLASGRPLEVPRPRRGPGMGRAMACCWQKARTSIYQAVQQPCKPISHYLESRNAQESKGGFRSAETNPLEQDVTLLHGWSWCRRRRKLPAGREPRGGAVAGRRRLSLQPAWERTSSRVPREDRIDTAANPAKHCKALQSWRIGAALSRKLLSPVLSVIHILKLATFQLNAPAPAIGLRSDALHGGISNDRNE